MSIAIEIMGCWKLCRLVLLGKITLLNSLIASQLVYIFSPLQIHHIAIKEIMLCFITSYGMTKATKLKER